MKRFWAAGDGVFSNRTVSVAMVLGGLVLMLPAASRLFGAWLAVTGLVICEPAVAPTKGKTKR